MSYGGLVEAGRWAANDVPRKGENMTGVLAGERMRGNVVCDLDGVVYRGTIPIEGAADALRRIEGMGFNLLFVTNNSTRTPVQTAAGIARITGYEASDDQVLGSAQAAAALLAGGDVREAMVVGGPGILEALEQAGISTTAKPDRAGAVVVGLDREFTYRKLDAAASAIRNGARFIATNNDVTFPGAGGIHPGAGAIVAAIAAASGTEPEIAGKPHEPVRKLIRERLRPGPVWVVGDRPETDIALALAEGWHSALVLTGIVETPSVVPPRFTSEVVIESIVRLPDVLA